mgnify:CR=1 FL=1
MKLKVLLFAAARELSGQSEVEILVDQPATVASTKQALAVALPDLAGLVDQSALAVDNRYVDDQFQLTPEFEIALIPPVSGG